MSSDIDKLKALGGQKIKFIKTTWDTDREDFFLDCITFEDGTSLQLYANSKSLIEFWVEE